MLSKQSDLQYCFDTTDNKTIAEHILNKGEIQVSEQEREAFNENLIKDIATIVAEKTINSQTNKPYTVSLIQDAMKEIKFSVNQSKSAKVQALLVIRKLKDCMPIVRANMKIRLSFTCSSFDAIKGVKVFV